MLELVICGAGLGVAKGGTPISIGSLMIGKWETGESGNWVGCK